MQAIFGFSFHAFVVLGMLSLGYLLYTGVTTSSNRVERMIRAISIATGVFIYGAAKALGMTLTNLIKWSVEFEHWLTFMVVGIVIPSVLGILLAKYTLRVLKSGNYLAMRFLLIVGSVILMQFCDLYIEIGLTAGLQISKELLPNLLFLSCFGLFFVFEFRTKGFTTRNLEPAE